MTKMGYNSVVENFYEILRIKPNATPEEIKKAFVSLAYIYHPDRYTGDKEFAEKYTATLTEAYCTLRDPIKRMDYDVSHNINKNPSKFERKHAKKMDSVVNEKTYTKPISSKYFRNSKRKKSGFLGKIFRSKLFYCIMFVLLLEMGILFLIFGGVFD